MTSSTEYARQLTLALADSNLAVALGTALLCWEETRHPLVADVVESLSAEAVGRFSAPQSRTNDDFQKAWLATSTQSDHLASGWLASTLLQKLAVDDDSFGSLRPDYTQTKYAAFFARMRVLETKRADPRMASALCCALERAEMMVESVERTRPIYELIVSVLVAQADVRSIARLEQLLRVPTARTGVLRTLLAELIPPAVEALRRTAVQPLDDETPWRSVPIRPVSENVELSLESLLANVYQDIDNDSLRAVYADALLEAGQARGEFISLQLTKTADEAHRRRVSAMLKANKITGWGLWHRC